MTTTAWLKDGRPLAADGQVAFTADMSSVMINPLQKEDNGVYTCELSNAVSKVTDSYKMEVNCECDCVWGRVGVEGGREEGQWQRQRLFYGVQNVCTG